MKLLLLTSRYPYSVDSGGLVKTRKIIEHLSGEFDLKIFTLNSEKNTINFFDNVTEIPLSKSKYNKNALNLFFSYLFNKPLSVYRNANDSSGHILNELLVWCDAILVDHFFMFQYVPGEFNKPIFLHQHNAEFKLWERTASKEKNPLKKALLHFESVRVKQYEKKICNIADVIFASPNDITELEGLGVSKQKFEITYHLGDDSMLRYEISKFDVLDNTIAFIGNLNWNPNRDGVFWFLNDIWPQILKKNKDAKFYIIGSIPEKEKHLISKYQSVIFCGFVEDLNTILEKVKVFVSPLRFGSGMKVKNITALYRGLPIVTTRIGAEGIYLENNYNSIICDDPDQFASSVNELLNNSLKCEMLAKNAKDTALDKYSWDKNLKKMSKAIYEKC
ncbi:glycosyltransferase [Buttiauxella sp. A111]|uniref:glycosyltransferase n=1 Tax=Buttiauxella sp. A111 TaxID=2563088 RepID=UPI0010F2AC5D|nr:glycosyltransferase [Buttiauxella sp. A111]GDX07045.1 glycosyl transferase group 1 [Buttiauxella sp. A111]